MKPLAEARMVRGACPHDCPDTCALQVTVQGGRVVRVAGDPDHPTTHGALCTKVSRYAERSYHPERVLQPLRRVGPKGSGRFEPLGWDEALDTIASAAAGHCRARPAGHPALQLCRHHGPGAGRRHGRALLQPAGRVAAGPHHLRQRRRRSADRHLRRQGRHARGELTPRAG
jgi:anaerobic selenocysteine-containing dehydrogenase